MMGHPFGVFSWANSNAIMLAERQRRARRVVAGLVVAAFGLGGLLVEGWPW